MNKVGANKSIGRKKNVGIGSSNISIGSKSSFKSNTSLQSNLSTATSIIMSADVPAAVPSAHPSVVFARPCPLNCQCQACSGCTRSDFIDSLLTFSPPSATTASVDNLADDFDIVSLRR